MTEPAPPPRYDLRLLGRAFRAADTEREASLNALLYASAALVASAVLLVTTTPVPLAVLLAIAPWAVLVGLGAWWIGPALHTETVSEELWRRRLQRARAVAVDLVLRDEPTPLTRTAAQFLADDGDRKRADELLGLGE